MTNFAKSGDEDTTIAFTLSDFTTAFNDVDGDSLSKIQITALPTNGVLRLNGTDVTLNQEIAAADLNNLTFVPTAHFNGTDGFGWNGSDGTAYAAAPSTVTLTINNVNDPPLGATFNAPTPVYENTPGAIAGFIDPVFDIDEGDTFTFSVDDDRFEFVGNQLKLKDGVSLDFEALGGNFIPLLITVTDAGGLSDSAQLRLPIYDVDEGPDTVPPAVPQINVVATDDIINQAEKEVGVRISVIAEVGSSLSITWGSVTQVGTVSIAGYWSPIFDSYSIPADGNTTISVTATDRAGNVSAVGTRSVLVDTTPPGAPAIALTTDSNIPTDNYTNVADITLTGIEENTTVQYRINNGGWLTSYTTPTTNGYYTVDVRQLDQYGNASNTSTISFYLDTTAEDPTVDPVTSDNVINAAEAIAGATLSGTTRYGAQISLTMAGLSGIRDAVVIFNPDNTVTWSYTLTPAEIVALGQGSQNFTLAMVDLAGNTANPVTHTFTIDTIAPSATVNAISSLSADSRIAGDFITNQANQTVTGTFTGTLAAGESIQVSANGGTTWNTATINSNTWSAADVVLQPGSRNLLTRTVDTAGNAIAGASRTYTLDRSISTIPALTSYSNPLGTSRFILNGIAESGSTVTVRKGTTTLGTVLTANNGRWSLNTPNLTNGRFNLTARSVDVAGNVSTSSITTFVTGNAGNNRLAGGNGNQILVGYNGNDRLNGGNGNDILLGGSGRDVLTGGSGGDRFNLTGARRTGADTLSDFTRIDDRILVSQTEFGLAQSIGSLLDASLFRMGTSASTASQRFIYDRGTGSLFFDADGSGIRAQTKIANLSNKAVLSNRQIELTA